MRPPLLSGGNFAPLFGGLQNDSASMRPPLLSGGNAASDPKTRGVILLQ
jgi:hypothetical protein